jgi:hypothetical protein
MTIICETPHVEEVYEVPVLVMVHNIIQKIRSEEEYHSDEQLARLE